MLYEGSRCIWGDAVSAGQASAGRRRLQSDAAAGRKNADVAAIDSISQVPERPTVVATFSILADWVRQIAGHDVHVTCLVGPGGNAHTFEPTSLDAVMLSNADLISEMGAGFEVWLTSLVAGSGSLAVLLVVSDGLPVRQLPATR